MFNTSTKVAVLASSNTKNIGPKHGSIGYAVSEGAPYYVPHLLSPNITDGIMLSRSKVAFIRYGFGKERPKYEYKPVLNVFPIIDKSAKTEGFDEIVTKVVNKFSKEDFGNKFWLNSKANIMGATSANVCIMAPILTLGVDLRTCSNLEFSAWFNNTLNSYDVKSSLSRIIANRYYLSKLPSVESRQVAVNLRSCMVDLIHKSNYLRDIIDSSETRTPVIEFTRLLYSITKSAQEKLIRKQTARRFRDGELRYEKANLNVKSDFFRVITYNLFSDSAFEYTKNMVPKGINSAFATIRVGHTKKIFVEMAHDIATRITNHK
jgi:hypothetical protein